MAGPRTVLITGANRGIGYSILRALATASPSDHYLLAGRSKQSIDEAIASLRATPEVKDTIKHTLIEPTVLDVTDDESILAAAEAVKSRFGKLDVLVNNAGIAQMPSENLAANRAVFAAVLDANVTSVANVTQAFLPLLRASAESTSNSSASANPGSATAQRPLVVNISSGRASLTRSITGNLPPTASIPYSVSKVALNALTIELAKTHPDVAFQCANPGHCKTAFNGWKGARDPLEGADVVVALVEANWAPSGGVENGFWETAGASKVLDKVPW